MVGISFSLRRIVTGGSSFVVQPSKRITPSINKILFALLFVTVTTGGFGLESFCTGANLVSITFGISTT